MNLTVVQLSDEQVEILKFMQEHYDKVKKLMKAEAFYIRGGRVIMDFDDAGTLNNIKKELNYHY